MRKLKKLKQRFLDSTTIIRHTPYRLKMIPKYINFWRNARTFEAKSYTGLIGAWGGGNGGSFWIEHSPILGGNPNCVEYLIKRFWYPTHGSDSYKDVAEYIITTPLENVKLGITIKAGGFHFSHYEHPDLRRAMRHEDYEMFNMPSRGNLWFTEIHLAKMAIDESLKNLLKPVAVRDSLININGAIDDNDEDVNKYYDDEGEPLPTMASVSPASGLGIDSASIMYQTEEGQNIWFNLLGAIEKLGDGDFYEGVKKTIDAIGGVKDEG